MEHDRLPQPVPDVIKQEVDDGAVLFLPSTEIYFGLNHVGLVVWSLLPPKSSSFAELCDSICQAFPGVGREVIEQDVGELLDDLIANMLVTPPDSAGTAGRTSGTHGG